MKDITLVFCLCLALVLSVISLDHALDRVSKDAAQRASHDLPGFYTSLEAAFALARESDKPLIVVFGRRDDAPTQKLKSEVLTSSAVNAIKERFVWAYLDVDQERNQPHIVKYDVFDTPATCILDENGRATDRIQGHTMPYLYARQLQRALSSTAVKAASSGPPPAP